MKISTISSIVLLLALTLVSISTVQGRADGEHSIVGRVYSTTGRLVGSGIRVRMTTIRSFETRTTTDHDGKFLFTDLDNGTYTVSIDEESDFVPVSQQVDISLERKAMPQAFYLIFRLTPKPNSGLKAQVINTENAGVPKRALDLYSSALALSATDDHKGALAQLKLAVAEHPEFMLAHTEMGVQYLKLNELDKADEALQAALKIKPDAYEPLINRGIVMFRSKRFAEAEPILRSALKAKDQSAVARFYLGRTFVSLKRYDEAEQEFYSAITIGGEQMKEAHRMLASMFLDREDYKRALTELEIYLKLAPAAPDADQLRGVVAQLKTLQKP